MMLPLKNSVVMVIIVIGIIPLLRLVNIDWYYNLTATVYGQISMAIAFIFVFISLNKSINLCEPVEYDV